MERSLSTTQIRLMGSLAQRAIMISTSCAVTVGIKSSFLIILARIGFQFGHPMGSILRSLHQLQGRIRFTSLTEMVKISNC